MDNDVDVLVVGGGIAGLTVSAELALRGREVGVVEVGASLGGSALLSEGYVWTCPDLDSFLVEDPEGDGEKFAAMRGDFAAAMDELRARGVEVGPPLTGVLGFGEGNQIDVAAYILNCRRLVERAGWILVETDVSALLREDGRVVGARVCELATGEESELRAGVVVLATGGFQGNPELRARYLGEWTRDLTLRANPNSTGRGLELGLSAGGAETASMSGFYGRLIPEPLDRWSPEIYTLLSQYYSEHGVLLDKNGRVVSEEGCGDHVLAQDVARVGTALLFIDSVVWEQYARVAFIPGMEADDKVLVAQSAGGHVSMGDDIDELVAPIARWGFDAGAVARTLRRVHRGEIGPSPRLTEPPYALLEVKPAITFTLGGLRTAVAGRVLDASGSPVAGLYAAGVDAGGLNVRGYTGGLVRGITLGRVAARAIDAEIPVAGNAR